MEGPLSSRLVKGAVTSGARRFYEFGPFRLDPNRHRLFRGDEVVALSPKAIETLILLVENRGKLLERETLMDALWPHVIVEDANLTVAVSQLRKALNQNGEKREFIETIPRVGYRFVADVCEVIKESIISKFSKFPELKVISRASVFIFKGKEIDPIEAGRRLGVGSIVEGSLLKSKDRIRVQLRLVAAADGHIIWSGDSYERDAADIFEVQAEISCN